MAGTIDQENNKMTPIMLMIKIMKLAQQQNYVWKAKVAGAPVGAGMRVRG